MLKIMLPLLPLLLINSCTGDILWHRYAHVSPYGWHDNDTISFELPTTDTEGVYSMDIELRTTPAFAYQQLYVVRQIQLSHPTDILRDTICIQTSTDGQSLTGDGVIMQSFSQQAPEFYLNQGQQVRVQLFHIMSRGIMPDIVDLGIKVKAAK